MHFFVILHAQRYSMNINEATWEYVRRYRADDVRKLALQGSHNPDVDLTLALQQIAGYQTARRKLPSWADTEGIIYPPHLNMEQCSSEQTARYKAGVAARLRGMITAGDGKDARRQESDGIFVDLTGGFGIDFYWMSHGFAERHYVEQDEALCAIAEQNFRTLGLSCSVSRSCASHFLISMKGRASTVYLDPARRNEYGGRTFGIADCTPNVLELLPMLVEKSDVIMLKLSPMLDWRKAVADLEGTAYVHEVHIVSVSNDCKELLVVLANAPSDGIRLYCVNDGDVFEVAFNAQTAARQPSRKLASGQTQELLGTAVEPTGFLYEPNASVMKAGCFAELEARYPVRQVAQNSHLFLSSVEIGDFPGRCFQIQAISSMNKREVNQKLTSMKSANISVRNFPMTVEQLRKKLKLKDGGDVYIFATTDDKGQHQLYICRKIS